MKTKEQQREAMQRLQKLNDQKLWQDIDVDMFIDEVKGEDESDT